MEQFTYGINDEEKNNNGASHDKKELATISLMLM